MGPLDDNINPVIINQTTDPTSLEWLIHDAYIWENIFFFFLEQRSDKYCEKIKGGVTEIKKIYYSF